MRALLGLESDWFHDLGTVIRKVLLRHAMDFQGSFRSWSCCFTQPLGPPSLLGLVSHSLSSLD